jgi:prepilin-type N-terminal cleavage/methylation domain-containing protein
MRSGLHQRGMSLIELLAATGIAGALSMGALGAARIKGPALTVAGQEIQGSLDQAFALARASGQPVEVSATSTKDIGHLPVSIPRSIHWGLPEGVPLPPHMGPTTRAATSGEAHTTITVTPRHTATATVWFLNDGEDALCLRVNDHGRANLLRWHASRHRWTRA